MQTDDWRLQGQEKYLRNAALTLKNYCERNPYDDHEHCEFCGQKFSDNIPGSLTQGYTTDDYYRWVCKNCFNDFKELFNWVVI